MKFKDYIECLQANSLKTGDLQAFYNKNSGIANSTGDYFYNLKYPPASHLIISDEYYTQGVTAVDTRIFPGRVLGTTNYPITNVGQNGKGYFNGGDLVQVGYEVKFSNWSAVLDISPDICDYDSGDHLSRIIFSTMDSHDSVSGFYVGINQANKLYIRYKKDDVNYSAETLNKELNKNSIIGISQIEDALSIGLYDLETEEVDQVSLNSVGHSLSNSVFLGNFGNNTNSQYYHGYQGFINNFALFEANLSYPEYAASCKCMFSTGVNVTSEVSSITIPNITGFKETPQYITGITGYKIGYKNITDDGVEKVISYEMGLTGLVSNGVNIDMLTGAPTVVSTTGYFTGAFYDQDKLDYYNRYYLNFNGGIKSGENIEILSFENPREDVQLALNENGQVTSSGIRLYNYGLYRQSKNDPSYMTMGERGESGAHFAAEGAGHDYDYTVLENKALSGFVTDENSITYDLIDRNSICIDFSGYWSHKTHAQAAALDRGLVPNKVLTGVGYFPSSPQFFNETDTSQEPYRDQGQVLITGISGQKIWEDNHIYYNGQKLIENIDFFTGNIETGSNLSIDALVITGGIPGVSIYGNTYNSIINTSDSFYTPQMCFVPKVSGEKPQELLKKITNDADGIPDPLSGFSEMVWLNGIRLEKPSDYKRGRECSMSKTFTFFGENPFIFYNNNEEFLNYG